MRWISKIFFQGLLALLPISLSVYAVYWLGATAEKLLGGLLKRVLTDQVYFTGAGVVAGLALVMVAGLLLNLWIVRKVFELADKVIERIPLVKTVYGSVRDLMGFFGETKGKSLQQVVLVRVAEDLRLVGFVTRREFEGLPEALARRGEVLVYLPMSYQLGGFTLYMPADRVEPVDMSVEQAMRFALTAGMSTDRAADLPAAPATDAPDAPAAEGG